VYLVSNGFFIRRASSAEIDEMVAIDTDACALYERAGIHADLGPEHPYSLAERAYWTEAARKGGAFVAGPSGSAPVGLLIMERIDGAPYLEQLSVRMSAQGRGLGRWLLARAIEWAGGEPLWLTTYAHLPWNRPFYERHGFLTVPEPECPPGMVAILNDQRRALPAPEHRIAMRRIR
jgi:GNAT superfamily N-acetyltransferase